MKILAVISSEAGQAHFQLASEALRHTAAVLGHELAVETNGGRVEPGGADVVLLVGRGASSPAGSVTPAHAAPLGRAIRETREVVTEAVRLGRPDTAPAEAPRDIVPASAAGKRIVAITACPTGIAHTFMAAEALQKAARALGHTIRIETQGSVGAKTPLTPEEIGAADAVVIAAETKVDTARFAGKPVFTTSTKHAMRAGQEVVRAALEQPAAVGSEAHQPAAASRSASQEARGPGPYKHLMTGVSYMLPVVIAGGLAIALAFALGGIYAADREGTLAWALNRIGAGTAFQLFVAVLSGYIAWSIADRPGLAPGLIGGMLAQTLGAGFLGGIASGFLAGYLTRFLATRIRLPATLEGLKPVLILPFLSTLTVGLLMIFVIAPPVQAVNAAMNAWLLGMRGTNAALLGLVLGAMMALDVGGPVNKAAYTFAVGLLGSGIQTPMAAVMAAGMTPPLGLALATFLFRGRFDADERRAGGPAFVLGLAFISEGAIPFAAKDPFRVIPALVLGSAVTGVLSMLAGVRLQVPHGGIFAAVIPGAVTHLAAYLGAIAAGTLVTTGALFVLKRRAPGVGA
jgi:PTS system fructose-specific IIC component